MLPSPLSTTQWSHRERKQETGANKAPNESMGPKGKTAILSIWRITKITPVHPSDKSLLNAYFGSGSGLRNEKTDSAVNQTDKTPRFDESPLLTLPLGSKRVFPT